MQPSIANMNSQVRCILRLKDHNLGDLERLHKMVYNKQPQEGFFAQKYNTAYTGAEYVGYLAYNHDMMPIAFYGVIPCFMSIQGRKVLVAQSADTMTHSQYRSLGLFTQLAEQTYELCKKMGIAFVFGFPNQNSLPGFVNKLGWKVHGTMARFTIPVKALPLEKLSLKIPLLSPVYEIYKRKTLSKIALLPGNIIFGTHLDGLLRDTDYIRYKQYSNAWFVTINGMQIWLKACGSIFIGDMINADETNFKGAVDGLIGLTAKLGLDKIHFHCSKGMPVYDLFASCYQPEESFPIIFKDLGKGYSFEEIRFTFADIDIF